MSTTRLSSTTGQLKISWEFLKVSLGLGLIVVLQQTRISSYADNSDGLAITHGTGEAVNVSLDTEASYNVSIRRNEQAMIIRIPPSFHSKLYIDPALKTGHVIQETENSSGRTIVIQSQQIYLSTHESTGNKSGSTSDNSTVNKDNGNTETSTAEKDTLKYTDGIVKPNFKEEIPDEVYSGSSGNHSHAGKNSVQKDTAESDLSGKGLTSSQSNLISHTGKLNSSAKDRSSESSDHQDNSHTKNAQKELKKNASKNHTKRGAQDRLNANNSPFTLGQGKNAETQNAQSKNGKEGDTGNADPESQPLEPSSSTDPLAHTPALGWFRITISLIIVLSLALGCIRWLLPKLVANYPQFFEKLKSSPLLSNLQGNIPTNPYHPAPNHAVYQASNTTSHNIFSKAAEKMELIPENPSSNQPIPGDSETLIPPPTLTLPRKGGGDFSSSLKSNRSLRNGTGIKGVRLDVPSPLPGEGRVGGEYPPLRETITPLSPSQYAQKPFPEPSKQTTSSALSTVGEQPMQIITSSNLEGGKALHLVDIQGRQFLVASTPDNITLLKDLTEPVGENPTQQSQYTQQAQHKPYASLPGQQYYVASPPPKPYCIDAEEVVVLPDYDDVYNSNL